MATDIENTEHDGQDDIDDFALPAPKAWFTNQAKTGWFLIVASVIGLYSAFDLSVEKYEKLENPNKVLSCDFNPFFSCGDVMTHPGAQLFGFPNQLLGIGAFIFPLLLGVLLVSRARIPGWIMVGLNVGLLFGLALCTFLFIYSIYIIGIGCPWCIVVWTVTIPMFWLVTGYNTLTGNFGRRIRDNLTLRVIAPHALLIGVLWMVVIYGLIVVKFWEFFGSAFT